MRRLTFLLGFIAGWVDAFSFSLLFEAFVSHQTGNTTRLGVDLGRFQLPNSLNRLVPIPLFIIGIVAGAILIQVFQRSNRRHCLTTLIAIEASLLTVFLLVTALLSPFPPDHINSVWVYIYEGCLALAMGIQTAAVRQAGGLRVATTFMSGMLTHASFEFVRLIFPMADLNPDQARAEKKRLRSNLSLSAGTWLTFVTGAAIAVYLADRIHLATLAIITLVLWAIFFWQLIRPAFRSH